MHEIVAGNIGDLVVNLPPSKSITHRALILAALNSGETRIVNPLASEDTDLTRLALEKMGAEFTALPDGLLCRAPLGRRRETDIYLGNSGSSARFLLPLGAFLDGEVCFSGTPRLHQRPMGELLNSLKQLGAHYQAAGDALPVRMFPGALRGGRIQLPQLPTSQVISGLMMAALWMESDLRIEFPAALSSRPYVELTAALMQQLNLKVELGRHFVEVAAARPHAFWEIPVEHDWSAASYWVALGLIHGVKVTFPDVLLPSSQGDEQILAVAENAGGRVMAFSDRVEVSGGIDRAFDVDCAGMPDLVPSLAVLGLFAPGAVRLRNVSQLRFKESDRIAALQENLALLGGGSDYHDGCLTIRPAASPRAAKISSHNDHRIAMSFAIAGTRIPGIVIDNPDCVQKSYPQFWKDFAWWRPSSGESQA